MRAGVLLERVEGPCRLQGTVLWANASKGWQSAAQCGGGWRMPVDGGELGTRWQQGWGVSAVWSKQ